MLQALGDRAGEASTWHQLATIDLREGDYASSREKCARALQMRQALGDRAGEASTWHQLATIDLNEGDYVSAREKCARALRIKQAIGDRAGEAAALYQLGFVALKMGRGDTGARLVAICWLIGQSIGHEDTEGDFRALSGLCSELGYDQAQFDAMLAEAVAAYEADGGRELIERAFADGEP
jgi:tetratricopeptide (TPR) repeat protein